MSETTLTPFSSCSFACPQPYDFELSTARFDVYGLDRATLWRDGGIHRVFAGREVRIEAAPGGVDVEPHDETIEAEVLPFLGLPFDLDGFYALGARATRCSRRLVARARGLRPPLQPDPFEALVTSITAQQVSLHSAFADPEPVDRALRRRAAGTRYAFPTSERMASANEDELIGVGFSTPQGGVRRRCCARSDLDWDELASLPGRRGQGAARRAARARRVDRRLVPRPPPRPAARLARRRPGTAEGGRRVLW